MLTLNLIQGQGDMLPHVALTKSEHSLIVS